uniref:WD repeat-containing protein 37-like n=3 Tax=Hirondellea gigas TaxID=1518452 RepID=A0A6A7G6U5_9CRUS
MPGEPASNREKSTGDGKKRGSGSRVIPRVRSHPETDLQAYYSSHETVLPPQFRARLQEWFVLIEHEFEALYTQNLALQEKVETLTERLEQKEGDKCGGGSGTAVSFVDGPSSLGGGSNVEQLFGGGGGGGSNVEQPFTSSFTPAVCSSLPHRQPPLLPLPSQPLKTAKVSSSSKSKAAVKLRVQTSRIVSSFKTSPVQCRLTKQFLGHRDGVWDVDTIHRDCMLLATASADQSACIWGVDCGRVVLQYTGHSGSVNSVRFHPTRELVLTASGDYTAHIWQAAVSHENLKVQSSEDEVDGSGEDEDDGGLESGGGRGGKPATLRTPLVELRGHSGVVSAADWMTGGEQVLTASWDRLACIYDANTGQLVSQLTGHDRELNHCCCHPSQRLVATASQDTTFRLYDSRDHRHTVSVFQGHTESVTSVCFTKEDKVISGSDDRSVKVWDVKNMRSPLATIRLDSPVNRLAVSPSGTMIGIPHDNRQVRLYDLAGQRLARLPHSNRQGHRRMVCAVAWADDGQHSSYTSSSLSCNPLTGSGSTSSGVTGSLSGGTGSAAAGAKEGGLFAAGVGGVNQPALLFTAGFDRRVYGWEVSTVKEKE